MAIRTNLCPNPALANDASGWYGGSRATGITGMLRSTGYLISSSQALTPQAAANDGTTYTYSFYFKPLSNDVITFGIDWHSGGSYLSSVGSSSQSVLANQVYRFSVTATAPSGQGVTGGLLTLNGADGYVTAVLVEVGSTLGTYFDGSTAGGSWTGSSGNSTSTISGTTTQTISPTGIPSGTAFGHATVTKPFLQITAHGIPSGTAFGHATVSPGPVTITATGIPSGLAFGHATEIGGFLIGAHGIPSALAFGHATVTPGPVTISPTGIPSGFTVGFHVVKRLVSVIPNALITKPENTVSYLMVCVHRVPQSSGPPTFIELDSINWSGLSYTESLNRPDTLTAGVSISSLTQIIKDQLIDQAHKGTEIFLYREGKLVFAGPWLGWQVQNQTLTITAKSIAAYLGWYLVQQDLVFAQQDQFTIMKTVIDQWQNLSYGNFGIDTSMIGLSGVLRDATYLKIELDYVDKVVNDLSARVNGFDWWIDPKTRELKARYPTRGIDRSSGSDAIIFDEHNVQNTNIICSSGPNDIATDGYGTGTSTGSNNGPIYSVKSNTELRQHFGRAAIAQNFQGVSEQPTLDAYTQAMVDSHGASLLIPGPDARVTVDTDLRLYNVGDTVSYQLHSALGVQAAYRLLNRQVVVSTNGKETVTVAFV